MERLAPRAFSRRLQAGIFGGLKSASAAALLTAFAATAGLAAYSPAAAAAAPVLPSVKPAPPGPTYISAEDKTRLLAVAKSLKSRDFATAKALTALVADPIAGNLGQWMYLMGQDPDVDFREAETFLDGNPDWPMRERIHGFVEKHIPTNAAPADVLAFFDTSPPVTGEGKMHLARALLAVGDRQGAERLIRDGWINDTFTIADENRLLANYGSWLTKEDHAARVDRLLWRREVTNARRVFPHLTRDDRRAADVRAALLLGAPNAGKQFANLPENMRQDSGMLHAATRYHRRAGSEQYAIALAAQAPKDASLLRNGDRWWEERHLLMRWALKNGRFADAYALAAENSLSGGANFAEAEYYAGWVALRFLDDPQRAETHFLALASEVGSPISVSRAQYWLGRAAAAKGDHASAKLYYARAAQHYYSYYGQLAAEEIGAPADQAKFAAIMQSTPSDRALFASRPTVAALRMLSDLDLDYEFMVFAYHVDDQLERPGEYVEFAKLTNGENAPHLTVRAGKVGVQRGAFAPDVAYPLVYVPEDATRFAPAEIILGLSRQESEFNPRAYSRAGARGMMQLIPTTAQVTARKEGLTYNRSALLDDPSYNMVLGAAHLSHLLERFDGSMIMTFAAYNAGAARVDQWVTEYGDPRSPAVDPLDWVELIPFSETRNYVQRVLENVQVYRGRLNDEPIPGALTNDLDRGGPGGRVARGGSPSVVLASAGERLRAQTIPPVPDATRERARKYQMEYPLVPPPEPDAVASDEGAASTINYPAESVGTEKGGKRSNTRRDRQREKARSRKSAPAPIAAEPVAAEPVALAEQESAPSPAPTLMILSAPEPQTDLKPGAPGPVAAPAEKVVNEDADVPMILEAMADSMDDLSSVVDTGAAGGADIPGCLTYRAFIASEADDDADAAGDLNAGMLAELTSGGPTCE